MKKILILLTALLASCTSRIEISAFLDEEPSIWPDYKDVTVPWNIAPLCFSVEGIDGRTALIIKGEGDSTVLTSRDGVFNIPQRQWRRLAEAGKGQALSFTICRAEADGWAAFRPFTVHVSADAIDPYLVYRRITPGYGLWNRMGIYQRNLETYDESAIYENREGRGNCVNCHSFCEGSPERWQVHVRVRYGGTYIFDGEGQSVLDLKDKTHGKPVYANWHPGGRLACYSTNSTFFFIHTLKSNRWEVMDDSSDVMVVDVSTGEQYRSPLTSSPSALETFPCFSPDGRWLYFCSAEARADVVADYDSIRYSIVRVAFDAERRTFGNRADTLYNALCDGGSASFPRISPDGRWLCFTRSTYGNFSICHRDADLCLIDLEAFAAAADSTAASLPAYQFLTEANSPQVDSFHSWSRNSRWVVVASKRDDAIYTRPYFFHIDADGCPSKAFLLPQRDAKNHYDLEMDAYNIPELITGPIAVPRISLQKSPAQPADASVN